MWYVNPVFFECRRTWTWYGTHAACRIRVFRVQHVCRFRFSDTYTKWQQSADRQSLHNTRWVRTCAGLRRRQCWKCGFRNQHRNSPGKFWDSNKYNFIFVLTCVKDQYGDSGLVGCVVGWWVGNFHPGTLWHFLEDWSLQQLLCENFKCQPEDGSIRGAETCCCCKWFNYLLIVLTYKKLCYTVKLYILYIYIYIYIYMPVPVAARSKA